MDIPNIDRLATLSGDELAVVVLTEVLEQTRITAFGLVDGVPTDVGEKYQEFQIVDMRFQIIGDAVDPNVTQFCKNARDWWRTLGSIPIHKGGPKRIELTYEEAAEAYRALFYEYEESADLAGVGDRPPTNNDVAVYLRISPRQLYKFIEQWREDGLTWKPKLFQE